MQLLSLVLLWCFHVMPAANLEPTDFSWEPSRVWVHTIIPLYQERRILSLQIILPIEMATIKLQAVGAKIARRINNFAGTYCNRDHSILSAPSRQLAWCKNSKRQRFMYALQKECLGLNRGFWVTVKVSYMYTQFIDCIYYLPFLRYLLQKCIVCSELTGCNTLKRTGYRSRLHGCRWGTSET
jgi:hypothetical protein